MTPVKTKGALRRIHVMLRRWEIWLRMRELHGDPDIWLLESKAPADGSPWSQTREYSGAEAQVGPGSAVEVVESEVRLRLYAVHDYFVGLRTATSTRSVYSLHVMCRATIEACAFATWVFDPAVRPAERLLRGLQLTKDPLRHRLKSLRAMESDAVGIWDERSLSEMASARTRASAYQGNVGRVIEAVRADLGIGDVGAARDSLGVPSATQRVREMLCNEMGLPQELDAYHRMSGVAHSEALAIVGTWNWDTKRPSVDYFSFLEFLHLALCAIDFTLEGELHRWLQVNGHDDRCQHMQPTDGGVQYGSEAEFG